MLHYLITPHVNRHRYSVQLVLPVPYDNLLKLALPTWTPGSYVLREYAGRLTNIRAYWEENELPVRQVSKAQWVVDAAEAPVSATLRIEWEVFAYSVGIHDAYLDDASSIPALCFCIPSIQTNLPRCFLMLPAGMFNVHFRSEPMLGRLATLMSSLTVPTR